jgi:hypothetical protein
MGATLAFILFSYATWALGSFYWFLPVFMGFLVYSLSLFLFPELAHNFAIVKVRRVFRMVVFIFMLLVIADLFSLHYVLYTPYIASCMAILSSILWRGALIPYPLSGARQWGIVTAVGILAWATVALPPWLILQEDWIVIAALGVISLLFSFGNEWLRWKYPGAKTIHISMILAVFGVLLVTLLQYYGLLPTWSPD